jgi:transcriptional regulator with XRE-family HTH domain
MASAGGESRSANSPNRVEALITPVLLVWARETAGFDIPTAAKKIGVHPDRLAGWEQAQRRPSIPQLRKLANVYKRPIAVFYLPEPPAAEASIRNFRRLPGTETPETSPA